MKTKEKPVSGILNTWYEDPANWKCGIFYYNPKVRRMLSPKIAKWMGWTINFANPVLISILIGLAILVVVIKSW